MYSLPSLFPTPNPYHSTLPPHSLKYPAHPSAASPIRSPASPRSNRSDPIARWMSLKSSVEAWCVSGVVRTVHGRGVLYSCIGRKEGKSECTYFFLEAEDALYLRGDVARGFGCGGGCGGRLGGCCGGGGG